MFLHANLFHLLGNMLFLWIFGPAVEGRLGMLRYLALYFVTGFVGDLVQIATIGHVTPHAANLGASGAIMGLAGAYLYMFPFASISIFYQFWYRFGVADWAAQWVILYFLGFDLMEGVLFQGLDGVGHFVHLGAAVCGFFLPMLLRVPRDSEDASSAQAIRNDAGGDYSILSMYELEALLESRPGDVNLLMAFCSKAMTRSEMNGPKKAMDALTRHADALLAQTDPARVAHVLLTLPESAGPVPASLIMRLGAKLETAGAYDVATACYRRFYNENPDSPDAQTSLIRWARLTEQLDADKRNAAALYIELLQRFPNGSQSLYAETALRRLGVERPRLAFSAGSAAAPTNTPASPDAPPSPTPAGPTMGTVGETPSPFAPRWAEAPAPEAVKTPVWESSYRVGNTAGMSLSPIGGGSAPASTEPGAEV